MFLLNSQIPQIASSASQSFSRSYRSSLPNSLTHVAPFTAGSRPGDPLRFRYGPAARARVFSRAARTRDAVLLRRTTHPQHSTNRHHIRTRTGWLCARRVHTRIASPPAAGARECSRAPPSIGCLLSQHRLTLRGRPCRRNPPPRCSASHPSLCYCRQDLLRRLLHPGPPPAFCTRSAPPYHSGIGAGSIAIHFQSSRIRWVRCNTLLTGLQLPCLPPHCPYSPTSFAATPRLGTLSHARFIPLRLPCLPVPAH